MMPSWSSESCSSAAEHSMPRLSTPRMVPIPSVMFLPGIKVPGAENTLISPARAFGAPHTTCTGAVPSPVSTMQTRRRSAFGCCSAEITRAMENGASALALSSMLSTSSPIMVSLSASFSSGSSVSRCSFSQESVNFIVLFLENRDQTKAFAHQRHVFAKLALPAEISAVGAAPVIEAAVAFAFLERKGGVDLAEAAIGHLGGLDHATRLAASVEHDPALARRRRVRLVLGRAGRGLDALYHEIEQLVGQRRPVAERERAQAAILLGDGGEAHELKPPASVG